MADSFESSPGFTSVLDEACKSFVNAVPRAPEWLARYAHCLLDKVGRRLYPSSRRCFLFLERGGGEGGVIPPTCSPAIILGGIASGKSNACTSKCSSFRLSWGGQLPKPERRHKYADGSLHRCCGKRPASKGDNHITIRSQCRRSYGISFFYNRRKGGLPCKGTWTTIIVPRLPSFC